jgi:hypothetical protein
MNGRTRMCVEGNASAKLANLPRLRSASPRADISDVDQSMVGGSEFGRNAQYPLGVRMMRPGALLEKSLGSIGVKSVNKEKFCCHFISKVQITQSVICTFIPQYHSWDREKCPVHRWAHVPISTKTLDNFDFTGNIYVTITNAHISALYISDTETIRWQANFPLDVWFLFY